jgi:hypothetical protein
MDLAPLATAHAHARKAAALTQGPNLSSAREEHELAALGFAKAKDGTGDLEVPIDIYHCNVFYSDSMLFVGSPHTRLA